MNEIVNKIETILLGIVAVVVTISIAAWVYDFIKGVF